MARLLVDAAQIRTFSAAIFAYASPDAIVSLRVFVDGADAKPLNIIPVVLNGGGLNDLVENAVSAAQFAADHGKRAVFCPPVCGFSDRANATEASLSEGYAIVVDGDQKPAEARRRLEAVLGPPTLVVESGGLWCEPGTGTLQPKLHLYWRLTEPATGSDLARLKRARLLATRLVGGDLSNVPIVHPLRWPGSWHRKAEPRMATIVARSGHEIDLGDALESLEAAAPEPEPEQPAHAGPRADRDGDARSDAELIAGITSGRAFHPCLVPLAARLLGRGMFPGAVVDMLRGLMQAVPAEARDQRWQARWGEVPRIVDSAAAKWEARRNGGEAPQDKPSPLILSSAAFVAGFVPPDYLIDGLLQRRFAYSFTGQTGSGKTAVALLATFAIGWNGVHIGGREVQAGRVLYFAGENPDDVRQRWIAMAEHLGFDINTIDVHFITGVVSLEALEEQITREVEALGGVAMIVIDTSAAYFLGDDENSNVAMGAYARRLRKFTTLKGGPTVLINCHPPKNAGSDNLMPRGGGAFLAEVDGNLTCSRTDALVTVHWQGKFRGADFDPLSFETRSVTAERLKDSRGRSIFTVYAAQLSESEVSTRASQGRQDEDAILIFLADCETPPSIKAIAEGIGFVDAKGQPQKSKTWRVLDRLRKDKLATRERGDQYVLTDKGKEAAKRGRYNRNAAGATYG